MTMKKMIYQENSIREVLATGDYLGFTYYILNLGTHPTAYIKIPENHEYYKKDYDDIDLSVHGGLTFASDTLNLGKNNIINGWFIGWDYAHYGDYLGYEMMHPQWHIYEENKKWTTEEILEEVKKACKELSKSEVEND